jgi:beta-xylosidase
MRKLPFLILIYNVVFCLTICPAQTADELEFNLDLDADTVSLPNVLRPNIDLSGRGFHREPSWPQVLAAEEVLRIWERDIGFNGVYRLQYNLWKIEELAKDNAAREKLLANYETILKRITDAGGVAILDLFGMPPGLGTVLDKRSAAADPRAFKKLVKAHIQRLSCEKKFNIWYEVWSAPDLDSFFLGRTQDYLNLYRAVAESIRELEQENKLHIPVGGPSVSWWFQGLDGNTALSPENSLIYELIRFCGRHKLPLNFLSWHAYSTDPQAEKELTRYNKTAVKLIRDWLGYFNLDRNTPLIIDEWNYDSGTNVLPERYEKSNIGASYILSRLKNMHEAGVNYQLYFSLEDFYDIKEGVIRNVGLFWFDQVAAKYKGSDKPSYNIFRMLRFLGNEIFAEPKKFNDEFVGALASASSDGYSFIFYNYIDPEIVTNFLSRHIATLNSADRKALLGLIKSDELARVIRQELEIEGLRLSKKVKNLLKKAQELYVQAVRFKSFPRRLKLVLNGLEANYSYQRYKVDASCGTACEFAAVEEKEIADTNSYQEDLSLEPYSAQMIVLRLRPPEPASSPAGSVAQTETAPSVSAGPETTSQPEDGSRESSPQQELKQP